MATQPTKLPVPSESPRDLKFNAGKIDEFVTSMGWTYTDRFGEKHYTIEGINYLAQQAMAGFGYVILTGKTFTTGATISTPNQVLLNTADGEYYKWTGSFASGPKVVPVNSTPSNSGGIGPGAWIGVGDSSLRSALAALSGAGLIGFSQLNSYPTGTVGSALKSIRVTSSSLGLSKNNADAAANATLLNTKLQSLYDSGVREIYMDESYPVDPGYDYSTFVEARRVLHLQDFRFYGPGNFTAAAPYTGLYNVQVEDKLCGDPVLVNNCNIQISKPPKKTFKVVIFGDSISLDWADSLTLGISQSSIIKAELQAQNPGCTFTFVNRAIGGQTWLQANSKPTAFPSWYNDTSKNWVDYVISEDPDIVVMAFGMNDSMGFNMGTMVETINKLNTGLPYAHKIMCTCMVPSRGSSYNNGLGLDGLGYQEGRNFAAGAERTYAQFYGHSVIDLNRYFVQSRDGKDQIACELQEVSGATPTNGAYTGDQCVDFAFEALISGWDRNTPIYINCGGDQSEDFVYVGNTGTGKFVVTGKTEYIGNYYSFNSTIDIPTTSFWLVVTILNNECHVYIGTDAANPVRDGTPNTLITSFRMIRHGGIVRPKIGTGGVSSGNVSQIRVMLGQPTQRRKTITDREMWGNPDSTPARKSPYGGNGINHPSAQGIARVITPVIQSQDLRIRFSDLNLAINLKPNVTTLGTNPSAKIVNGVLYLKGGMTGAGATENAVLANIERWSTFSQSDYLAPTAGNSGTGWATRLVRIKANGDIVAEVGSNTSGVLLTNISIPLA
ncbi:tail fiber/spike domain-containing protein [Lelliottia nimipressuralis]